MNQLDVIKRVMTTEKGAFLGAKNRYMIEVAPAATKPEIKAAVEARFGVHVLAVRTQNYLGKPRMTRSRRLTKASDWKRAIVTLKDGERIEAV